MSYPINQKISPNINQYQQPLTGVNAPAIPGVDTDAIKSDINNSQVGKIVSSTSDNPGIVAGATLFIWLVLSQVMTKFNEACRGNKIVKGQAVDTNANYDSSIVGKIDKFGQDHIGSALGSKKLDGIRRFISDKKGLIDEKIISKSKILTAIFKTPSQPKLHMVQMIAKGTLGEVASDATTLFNKFTENGSKKEALDLLGMSKDTFDEVMAAPHDQSSIRKMIAACNSVLEKTGEDTAHEVTKTGETVAKVPLLKKLLGREVSFAEVRNKLTTLNTIDNPGVGKLLSKSTMRTLEGLTNGTAGGKFAILIQAYFIADAFKKAYHAPKGEKFKTFSEELTYGLGGYLTMPLAMSLMHKAGGLQYIGMKSGEATEAKLKEVSFAKAQEQFKKTKNKAEFDAALEAINKKAEEALNNLQKSGSVKDYRVALNAFNEKAASGLFETPEAHKEAKAILEKAYHCEKGFINILHKPLRWAGKLLTVGLETIRPFVAKESGSVSKFVRTAWFNLKRGAGFPMRFGVFLFVIAPFLGKLAVKVSHMVVGRPTHSVLDGETPDETKKEQVIGSNTQIDPKMPQAVKPQHPQLIQQATPQVPVQPSNSNLVNMYKTNPQAKNTQPSMVSATSEKPAGPVRTYIPSSEGVKLQPQEVPEKTNDAINKSKRLELKAEELMKGH